jgi:hypothetical protein
MRALFYFLLGITLGIISGILINSDKGRDIQHMFVEKAEKTRRAAKEAQDEFRE